LGSDLQQLGFGEVVMNGGAELAVAIRVGPLEDQAGILSRFGRAHLCVQDLPSSEAHI